jgi:cell division protein FtsB
MANGSVFVLTLRRRSDSLKGMIGRRTIVKVGRAVLGPFLAIVLIVYFGLNLIQGDHGLMAWLRRAHQVHAAEMTLAATDDRLAQLRHRTDLLKGEHLDADLLDERARAALNAIGPDEIVIFTPPAEITSKSD